MVDYGKDIDSSFSVNPSGDISIVSGVDNAKQAILNRLKTKLEELSCFDFYDYGNASYQHLGSTNIDYVIGAVEIETRETLLSEPRVDTVEYVNVNYEETKITVDASCILTDESQLDLEFDLEVFDTE